MSEQAVSYPLNSSGEPREWLLEYRHDDVQRWLLIPGILSSLEAAAKYLAFWWETYEKSFGAIDLRVRIRNVRTGEIIPGEALNLS